MPTIEGVQAYSQLPQPVLTLYLDTDPAKDSNRRPVPEFHTWLTTEAKVVAQALPTAQRKPFLEQVVRIDNFLRERVVQEHGMLIFAGADVWEAVALGQDLTNELHWGAPSVTQLLWFLFEHKPNCVVVVDRKSARFFRFYLGELTQLAERSLEVDISEWAKQDMGKFAAPRESSLRGRPGIKKARGSQRDTFQHRMDAQYARSCTEAAQQTAQLTKGGNLWAVFLIGSDRLVQPIARAFPPEFLHPVVKIGKDFGGIELHELEQRLAPLVSQWEQAHESESVAALLDDAPGSIVGIDETLRKLQQGRIRTLILARDLKTSLRRCVRCGWADRSADAVCSACRGERRLTTLDESLPEMAWKHSVEIEIVGGAAAEQLKGAEGIGGWLRQPLEAAAAKTLKRAG